VASWGSFLPNYWSPGQLVKVDLPVQGLSNSFVVQKVTITPTSDTLWTFKIAYGGRLIGIADFLKALVSSQQKKKLNETTVLHKFVYGTDTTNITDVILSTARTPPWICGDADAICGFIVCST
jgi:hypothetical protein